MCPTVVKFRWDAVMEEYPGVTSKKRPIVRNAIHWAGHMPIQIPRKYFITQNIPLPRNKFPGKNSLTHNIPLPCPLTPLCTDDPSITGLSGVPVDGGVRAPPIPPMYGGV